MHNTSKYDKENPYAKTTEIIQIASDNKDLDTASKRLNEYMEKEWFRGHFDFGWKNAHKEHGYYGLWSFDTAALVKILKLDDSTIKDNNHYPYDLAHYKNEMSFDLSWYSKPLDKGQAEEEKELTSGILNNPDLEQIIPVKFNSFVDEMIMDYNVLCDEEFWIKYDLKDIWFELEEYKQENKDRKLLGTLIVFLLVNKGFILQLDYKEDMMDYIENIHNYWPNQEVKLVSFELDNDQQYYAYVPKNSNLNLLYEVKVKEVEI